MRNPTLNPMENPARQSGVVLVTGLLFLLVVTIIAVTAANNSTLGMKMSGGMQDSYRSFQAAEAGIYAALGLAGTTQDPFRRQVVIEEPFQGLTDFEGGMNHPFRNQAADSNEVVSCSYYRIVSEHAEPGRARTQVQLGVVKTVIRQQGQ